MMTDDGSMRYAFFPRKTARFGWDLAAAFNKSWTAMIYSLGSPFDMMLV